MSKLFRRVSVFAAMLLTMTVHAQQLPNANFEDWSGAAFDGNPQPASWNASNVEQIGFKFNFAHKETGRNGGYCMMVQDQDVGAAGITETSPGYFALGQPWVYVKSLLELSKATAGTSGGVSWKYRPDSMSVWIRRTGSNTDKEDFYLLYYAWSGTARGEQYKAKDGSCTSHSETNEESDVRLELNGNECGTAQKATQVAEGMWREKKTYSGWTNIRVPIYYFNNTVPTMMNIIFSASNYPNYRANSGLYAGNSLYVDDVELIYSSRIQKLYIDNIEWRAFDPDNLGIQTYSLGESATVIPDIKARRGAGSITNAHSKKVDFPGRELSGSEISVVKGDLDKTPTVITVKSEDGKTSTVYRIQFQRAPSTNATLAEIAVNGEPLTDFRPGQTNYNVELPYGTTSAPVVTYTLAEDAQTAVVTQATSPTGKATIVVTAADKTTKKTYTLNFSVGQLKDVTLKDIKVNGKSIPGFTPTQAVYKVSLPVGTASLSVEPVSAYPAGEQTITVSPSPLPSGEAINGASVQVSVAAPGASSPKVYKLNIKLEQSSYSYLADLRVTGDQIADVNPHQEGDMTALAFDPEWTTYYVNLKMGTKTMPQIQWTPGDEYQTITKDEGGIDGTTRISVVAGNQSDQTVYKIVFSTAKSEISTLDGIEIDGKPLEGFAPDITNYSYVLPVGTTVLPEIKPIAHDEFQEIVVTTAGVNGKTRISVTAGNGNTTNYYITFSVATYTDNTLKSLSVAGYSLQDEAFNPVAFDPQRNDYWVRLDNEQVPEVTYELQNEEFQSASPFPATSPNGKYKLTVRPKNGASRTYTIQFVYKLSENSALQMIYINDTVALPGFEPDKTDYTFTLDTGTVDKPNVTWVPGEASQEITATWDWEKQRTLRITVKAENRLYKRTYKIKFYIPSTASTQLANIQLEENGDTVPLPGFSKDKYEYTYPLRTATCPKIIATPAGENQQVTITAPYAAGLATILVRMDENRSAYTIDFAKAPAQTVLLSDILVNGRSLKDSAIFVPTTLTYDGLTYTDQLPDVQGVGEGLDIQVRWKGNTAYLHVSDAEGNKAVYSLVFTRVLSGDNTLDAIYADGVLIDGFDKTKLDYAYNLPAGSAYPAISYQTSLDAQVVFFGQVAEGKWGITVLSEKGDKQTYTVQYTIAKYDDATLANLSVEGHALTPAFDKNTTGYTVTIDEGAALPELLIEPRVGQTVLQSNANDTLQEVIVFAQSGASMTYTVQYHRIRSSNALLADILINGVSLAGFDPMKENYVDSLDRNTQVVPNVFPVGQVSTQTITTRFHHPNDTTKIHVEAQDGTTKDYTIFFPVRQSDNALLGDLYMDSEEADIKFKATQTDYEVILPYEATACPKMVYEKADPAQRIDVISRPIGQTSQIIVTAENGNTNTYNILFKREVLKTRNLLSMIRIAELEQELSLKDKNKREFEVELPFGSRTMTVEYEKSYPEQTVFIEPGGVRYPTVITVKANNDTVADEEYRIIPVVPTDDPATLTDIRIKIGDEPETTITGFDPEQFSYIVSVKGKPKLKYTLHKGAEINIIDQTSKHWSAEVTYGERTNTYHVWYYYTKEQVPNTDFTAWEAATVYTSSQKPSGWNTVTDALGTHSGFGTFDPDQICTKSGTSVVDLKTKYSTPGGGNIPGFITLGKVTGNWGVAGSSSFSITGGIPFHNSPDVMQINYKSQKLNSGKDQIQYILTGSDGEGFKEWNNTETTGDYKTFTYDLHEVNAQAGDPTQLNIVLNSYYQVDGTTGNPLVSTAAEMLVDWIKFTYNHTLKSMTVDSIAATMQSKAFTVDLPYSERIEKPVLSFTGEVNDQAQTVTWGKPDTIGQYEVRKAAIRNFAENGTDYTDYTLQVRRPRDSVNVLKHLIIGGDTLTTFKADKTDYVIKRPSSLRYLPDLVPVPASSLQKVTTSYNDADSVMTITVTPEYGSERVYTVTFVMTLSDDVTLKSITAEGVSFDPEQTSYEVKATRLPLIQFEKQNDRQTVELIDGVLTVTAENGNTGTYTIKRVDPDFAPNGTITEFEFKGNVLTDLGGTTYDKEEAKPADYIAFTRAQATDTVIFVQASDKMTWSVPNTGKTYTWTYPTEASTNADLAMIQIDGKDYEDFMPSELNYELTSDTTMVVVVVPAEEEQHLTTTYEIIEGGVLYATTVQPQSGDSKTYTVRVTRPMSDIATLNGILLDSVLIDGFVPGKTTYEVTLPTGAYKVAQPKFPDITYAVGHTGQKVTVTPGELNGEPSEIVVTSEDGKASENYYLTVNAEKSHCSDLTSITVNGEAIGDPFEAGRHFYSLSLTTDEVVIDYTSNDNFQTVETLVTVIQSGHQYRYTLHVTAEDGTSSDYVIEIYVENRSNDAQLAAILLNGKSMDKFDAPLNNELVFDGGNNNYEIKMKADTPLPEVSARLKMDGQTVEISSSEDKILLDVTAVDGTTHNVYMLRFSRPRSTDSHLSFIEINNILLEDFDPEKYYYTFPDLHAGEDKPRVTDYGALDSDSVIVDDDDSPISITVYAEDKTYTSTYTIAYEYKKSHNANLSLIRADGDTLPGFDPDTIYYSLNLPVGRTDFPELYAEEGEEHQKISYKTVEYDETALKLVRQIIVQAEDTTFTRIYTVSCIIDKSANDALQMIYIGKESKQLPGFAPDVLEYRYQLTASEAAALGGELPEIYCELGDEWQDTVILAVRDNSLDKTLDYKHLITVKAAAGNSRTYTIQYPVELSSDATLNMIMLGGAPLANYDAERTNYKIELLEGTDIPVVSVVKKEEAQTYEITLDSEKDIVYVDVWAEDGTHNTYTLTFERVRSAVTMLANIILYKDGKQLLYDLFEFAPETYDYTIVMPYDSTITELTTANLPDMKIILANEGQDTLVTRTVLGKTEIQVTVEVKAANGDDGTPYVLLFRFTFNNNASLTDLRVKGTTINGFKPSQLDYTYKHPFGTDSTAFFSIESVEYVKADPMAADTMYMDEEGLINITVTAQDGKSQNTYSIRQIIGLDTVCTLDKIVWEGGELPNFDPEVTFYEYLLSNTANAIPAGLAGIPTSPYAHNVSIIPGEPNDTTIITCIAQDSLNYRKEYRIFFRKSDVNDGIVASSANEVFLRRVAGTPQLFASTIRSGVSFALYDRNGHMLFLCDQLPVADPNDMHVEQDGWNKDVLIDVNVDPRSGVLVDIDPRQVYFYSFFSAADGKKIKTGKLITLP